MDNLTHSLAGIVAAEVIVQVRARRAPIDPRWHRAAWLISAAAHNAPDLDFAYAWITEGKLGYLLHHRGHTHTLALAPAMAALAYFAVYAWARRARAWTHAEHAWAALIAGLGPIGHILLDLSNNYGVHPLWPIDDHWYAGDSIFIVEPLFWAATIPPILVATTPRAGRIAWGVVLALGMALPWGALALGLPWGSALACTVLALASLAASRRVPARMLGALALGSSLAVLLVFAGSGAAAERTLAAALAARDPDRRLVDVARSPMPANPLCWEALAIEIDRLDVVHTHLAYVSLAPSIVSTSACAVMRRRAPTAAYEDVADTIDDRRVAIAMTFSRPLASWRALAARCDGAAFLRFARAPFVIEREDALVVGDLRYDREESLGFAELELPRGAPERCPEHVPPWIPWREDLLAD